ncbi:hypothetical protein L1987_41518 [Smallanthus sonchifolius]|uniref:Uncharacterized protein n=1 Tax=Smallanthus sonchifolius TaxID=185202 RepID=A0ACB9GUZ0_9ASTR|nr:hypothetical protein L1987_41518 [Smallanthus sonchifolius]
MSGRPARLYTPLTVVAAGMDKWLDIYSGVLLVRVLLSWFPSIPWDRQPLSAIRDLCDPYLNLFRNIIPPVDLTEQEQKYHLIANKLTVAREKRIFDQ